MAFSLKWISIGGNTRDGSFAISSSMVAVIAATIHAGVVRQEEGLHSTKGFALLQELECAWPRDPPISGHGFPQMDKRFAD